MMTTKSNFQFGHVFSSALCSNGCEPAKNEIQRVKDELGFLSHQVAHLVHAFIYGQQRDKLQSDDAFKVTTSMGATLPIVKQGDQTMDSMTQKGYGENVQGAVDVGTRKGSVHLPRIPSPTAIGGFPPTAPMFYPRKRVSSVISVDQLLPRFLANDGLWETMEPRKRAKTISASGMMTDDKSVNVNGNTASPINQVKYDVADQMTVNGNVEHHPVVSKAGGATHFVCQSEHLSKINPAGFGFTINQPKICGPSLPLVTYTPKASTFFCNVCKRAFSSVYYKRHMIVHANSRPHVCDICGKRFNERSNMMKHRHRLHVP